MNNRWDLSVFSLFCAGYVGRKGHKERCLRSWAGPSLANNYPWGGAEVQKVPKITTFCKGPPLPPYKNFPHGGAMAPLAPRPSQRRAWSWDGPNSYPLVGQKVKNTTFCITTAILDPLAKAVFSMSSSQVLFCLKTEKQLKNW